MSLDLAFFERSTNISAKVICDSISEAGVRLTTFEVEAPRIILAEINTHNAISKNCSSTRAITLKKAIEQVQENGFTPLYWGKKKAGMSATEETDDIDFVSQIWDASKQSMIHRVEILDQEELHKQITGRLLEPFQMVKQVLTATDFDNFFNLRIHPTAQPEILMLAYKMYKALESSNPFELKSGEYHLPYVDRWRNEDGELHYSTENEYGDNVWLDLDSAIKISGSCVAQTSYRNTDMSLDKAENIFDRLIQADVLHASVFEHLGTPIKPKYKELGCVRVNCSESESWEEGITHRHRQGDLCSGNLRGWIQYRHLLPSNTCWEYKHEERMEMFK